MKLTTSDLNYATMPYIRVSLISCSQPQEGCYFVHDDGTKESPENLEELIAFCARISNPSNQHRHDTSGRLIKYLIKHKHWSPFEQVNACLEIRTTRDIARQILRHHSMIVDDNVPPLRFVFQEFSQRYAKVCDQHFVVRDARLQDAKNRQNSIETDNRELDDEWRKRQDEVIQLALKNYTWALDQGIAREQARAVLPEGNTLTMIYVNGNLRSWIHYIEARTSPDTQKEHREIAVMCAKAIAPKMPVIMDFVHPDTREAYSI